jgi:signal peptidase
MAETTPAAEQAAKRATRARIEFKTAYKTKSALLLNPLHIFEASPGVVKSGAFVINAPEGRRFNGKKRKSVSVSARGLKLKDYGADLNEDGTSLRLTLNVSSPSRGKAGSLCVEGLALAPDDPKAPFSPFELQIEDESAGVDARPPRVDAAVKKRPNILSIVFNTLILLFVLFSLSTLLTSFFSQLGYSFFGLRSFIVLSGSMSPVFEEGAYIITRQTDPEDIQAGDIVSYYVDVENHTVLTHRVEQRDEGASLTFRTKGDANDVADRDPVAPEAILGVAFFWVNGLGKLLLSLRQPLNLLVCVVVLTALFFIPDLFRYALQKEDEDDEGDVSDATGVPQQAP